MFDRENAIDTLVNSDFDFIMLKDSGELLESYLKYGFKGYSGYTDAELKVELLQRNAIKLFTMEMEG